VVANSNGDHADSVGIYLAFLPPTGTSNFGGCSPAGVISLGAVTLLPGQKITLKTDPLWECIDPASVDGSSWTLKAVADVHADDFGACSTLVQHFNGSCAAALASDDANDFNNIKTKARPIVVAQ
jgi:hypothetical protein